MEVNKAVEIFEKYGIEVSVDTNNLLTISNYTQPKEKTFSELGIDENELIEHVVACTGVFDTRKSALTTFPLTASAEIRLYDDINIAEMPNLKSVGTFVTNKNLKKLPKLKYLNCASFENSSINSLPKLKKAGILILQNSKIKELPALEVVGRLCIIDCPIEDLKELKYAGEVFICSSDENNKINIVSLNSLEEVDRMFVANSALKSMPKLKKAQKLALYNCEIKSVKSSLAKDVQIENHISDEELAEKFDTFTDWYNSDIFQKSMDMLGDIVNNIQG